MKTKHLHETYSGNIRDGIVFERLADGRFATNVPYHYATGASPDGFETGYLGSGPSELALNLVAGLLNSVGFAYSGTVGLQSGSVGAEVFALRHRFKEYTLGRIKLEPGDRYVLPYRLALAILQEIATVTIPEAPVFFTESAGDAVDIRDAYEEFRSRFCSTIVSTN